MTAYEMRMSDWSSDVCSSDLSATDGGQRIHARTNSGHAGRLNASIATSPSLRSRKMERGRTAPLSFCAHPNDPGPTSLVSRARRAPTSWVDLSPPYLSELGRDRTSTGLNSSPYCQTRFPSFV